MKSFFSLFPVLSINRNEQFIFYIRFRCILKLRAGSFTGRMWFLYFYFLSCCILKSWLNLMVFISKKFIFLQFITTRNFMVFPSPCEDLSVHMFQFGFLYKISPKN